MLAFTVSNKNSIISWLKGRWKVENSSIFALNSCASVKKKKVVKLIKSPFQFYTYSTFKAHTVKEYKKYKRKQETQGKHTAFKIHS